MRHNAVAKALEHARNRQRVVPDKPESSINQTALAERLEAMQRDMDAKDSREEVR